MTRAWSPAEIAVLQAHPTERACTLLPLLPGRNATAIDRKRGELSGITPARARAAEVAAARAIAADEPQFKPRVAKPCCWPIGEPGTPSFRFCEAATVDAIYCPEHALVAYPGRRSAAA